MLKSLAIAVTLSLLLVGMAVAAPPPPSRTGATPAQPRPGGAPKFGVGNLSLDAYPPIYDSVCPATIKFKTSLLAIGTGTVTYIFTRSDGAKDPVPKTVTVNNPYMVDLVVVPVETWTLGDLVKLPTYTGWATIKILSPKPMESNQANFKVTCSKKPPDLVVKKVKKGDGPVLWVTIANQGDGPAMGSIVCFSDPTDKSKSYGNSGVGPIAAGGEDQVGVGTGLLGELGVKVAKGVLITADCKNEVAESNENNNTYLYKPNP